MQQLADWLNKLGLSDYAECFRKNGIDLLVLPHLTDQDLKEMGVLLGHRRKLLAAIGELSSNVSARAPSMDTAMGSEPPPIHAAVPLVLPPTSQAAGERRYLTVMFCDLVDSTNIASRLDAEEWRDLVNAYLDAATIAVTEMGGRVARKQGDGLMALFGFPVARENDAERAARAALAIHAALTKLNCKNTDAGMPVLRARIGLEAGPVVVDIAGEIYGDAPNIAARVQALAEPGSVLVTSRVQRQVAGLFVAGELGNCKLKGIAEPQTLYRLVRASGGGRRGGQRQLTPLIGRDEELAVLMRRWDRARQGDGQLALIVGEPGLGKSRLIQEMHAHLRETPHSWVEWNCSQLLQNTALHPVNEWGRQRFGGSEIAADRRLHDLENTLRMVHLDPTENVPLLAPLVDVPLPKEREAVLTPDELRRGQLAALTSWVIAGAKSQPVVLVVEDLHWADPTTLDVLKGLAERGALAPLFVVGTTRPEFKPSWGVRSHHSTISLVPLDRAQVRSMVAELSARHALPPKVVDDVVARTGGVPLFVEEVTRLLLDRGGKDDPHVIPPSLQQSLMARLDRLGPAREVAQIGSVIGRGFSYDLLRMLTGMDDTALQAALERLAEADILLVQGLPPVSDYRFKHALIQDAAYENLLKSRRQVLHRRVTEILCDCLPETALSEPEALAHHFTQAGLTQQAVEWRGKAGFRSLERSALVEAAEHFARALDQLAHLPFTTATRRERINLQIALINPLMHIKGHAAPEARTAVERARLLIEEAEALGEPLEDPLLLFSVLYGSWIAHFVAFNGDLVHELAAEFLTLAERRADSAPLMIGHRIMGMALLFTGHITEGCANLDRAISLHVPAEHRRLATRFSVDPATSSLFYQAQALWCLGRPDAANAALTRGLTEARQIRHAATLMFALHMASTVHVLSRNYVQAAAELDELATITDESGAPYWGAFGRSVHGCLLAANDNAWDAVHISTAGISALRATGTTVWTPWYLSSLAMAYAELGRFDDARHTIAEALTTMGATKETWSASEIYRTAGEIELVSADGDATQAQGFFDRALAVARAQQAKSWELRAAMSITRLWRDERRSEEARELLAPVYEWFTEGFDTLDLQQAKALLAELVQ